MRSRQWVSPIRQRFQKDIIITSGPKLKEIWEAIENNTPVVFRFRISGEKDVFEDEHHIFGAEALVGLSTTRKPKYFRLKTTRFPGTSGQYAFADYNPRTRRGRSF